MTKTQVSRDEVRTALRQILTLLETERRERPRHGEPVTSWYVVFQACYLPIIRRAPRTGRMTLKARKSRPAGSLEHARSLFTSVTQILGDERGSTAADVRDALRPFTDDH